MVGLRCTELGEAQYIPKDMHTNPVLLYPVNFTHIIQGYLLQFQCK